MNKDSIIKKLKFLSKQMYRSAHNLSSCDIVRYSYEGELYYYYLGEETPMSFIQQIIDFIKNENLEKIVEIKLTDRFKERFYKNEVCPMIRSLKLFKIK